MCLGLYDDSFSSGFWLNTAPNTTYQILQLVQAQSSETLPFLFEVAQVIKFRWVFNPCTLMLYFWVYMLEPKNLC